MNVHVHTFTSLEAVTADSLLVFYTKSDALSPELLELDTELGGELKAMFADRELSGKNGSVAHIRTSGRLQATHLFLVGLGESDKLDAEKVREAAGSAARSLKGRTVAVAPFTDEFALATVEGLLMGRYVYSAHKSKPEEDKRFSELLVLSNGDIASVVEAAQIHAEAVNVARDYVNMPANLLDPVIFGDKAKAVGEAEGLTVEILDENQLKEQGLNLLHAVGVGSDIPPRLVVLKYVGAPDSQETLGMVGKGVTFDTGGYIIKPEAGMPNMHTDMGGAACVLFAMQAIARKKLKVNVIGILCLAENMISGRAFKPGDVAVAFNGKTVEMIDTDCEGRLVLADGVAYAKHLGATAIVDTATLTGAVVSALGYVSASLYGNDDAFVEQVRLAGAEVGEKLWTLPNFEEYQDLIDSKVADYINYSGRNAGAIAGGVFIAAFADDVPFCHIDMANMSRANSTKGYTVTGGTAFSTRTLIQLAQTFAK
ncbi:leucyl aminopeptidase [Tumebacillus sp. ITR2]|uniref:Probable cytosol aminopeptidase n=1 Tax=Tumebacillus amylolyticus TaxID=2801339 RepID=A0ABS1J8T9_9BACL|nr:leucyl aminopeptidase [Tumebacillus amylolyticus]MBL0386681.1 leucyl aminopeptidase [Tumebacillus amylolyticus]